MRRLRIGDHTYLMRDLEDYEARDLMTVEDWTGWTFQELHEQLQRQSLRALVAVVWLVRKQVEPGLKLDDVDFKLSDLEVLDGEEPARPPDPTVAAAVEG